MANNPTMKTLTIDGVTYEIYDEQARTQIGDLSKLNTTSKTDLVTAINEAAQTGGNSGGNVDQNGGMSATASALLITILRNAVYSTDQSANITLLESALASSGGSGDDSGSDTESYMVINSLNNVETSNTASTVMANGSYIASLAARDGYYLDIVTVKMGGVDITETAWNADTSTITIVTVTGDLIITASASEDTALLYSLPAPVTFDGTSAEQIINTGVMPFANSTMRDTEFTILADVETQSNGATQTVLMCVNPNAPWEILRLNRRDSGWQAFFGTTQQCQTTVVGSARIAMTHSAFSGETSNDDHMYLRVFDKTTGTEYTGTVNVNNATVNKAHSAPLYIGGTDSGKDLFAGTINELKFYAAALSDEEITAYFNS